MSPSQPIHNLTDADKQQLQNGLEAAKRGLAQIELARRAGFNVDIAAAKLADTKDKLERTLNTYFPAG